MSQASGALSERELQFTFALQWLHHWLVSCAPPARKPYDISILNRAESSQKIQITHEEKTLEASTSSVGNISRKRPAISRKASTAQSISWRVL